MVSTVYSMVIVQFTLNFKINFGILNDTKRW
jgi:hypothetical protein